MDAINPPHRAYLKHVLQTPYFDTHLKCFFSLYKIKLLFSSRKFTFCLPNHNSATAWGSRAHPWPRPPPLSERRDGSASTPRS